ncbi:MAG TPA: RNA 3'-terminal phosphate cyclase [Kofleriaceae bacterium]
MADGLIEIDGSRGEGGGQILRTALALSMITKRPTRIRGIRAGRKRPGLQPQHLACVEAAAQLCHAHTIGAEVDSQQLEFTPGVDCSEHVAIDIGTAGSTTLVVQTILAPAIVAGRALHATVIGGTHNPLAPPFEFLDRVFLPHLRAMGAHVSLTLDKHGVFPNGGGKVAIEVRPASKLTPIAVVEAGPVTGRRAEVIIARLPTHVADRELAIVRDRFKIPGEDCKIVDLRGGPANILMIEIERAGAREIVSGHGEKGLRAELVAERACDEMQRYLDSDVPVGVHLADQLLLPMALAGGGRFRTIGPVSQHVTTNIETINAFLDVQFRVEERDGVAEISVGR